MGHDNAPTGGHGDEAPLAGRRVVVTRARHQARPLCEALEAAGAAAPLLPLIELAPPHRPESLRQAAAEAAKGGHDWWVFTSRNAVDAWFEALPRSPRPAPRIAVVGPATARAVEGHGAEVSLEARRHQARHLGEELAPAVAGGRVLLPQAADARPDLAAILRPGVAHLEVIEAYRKVVPAGLRECAEQLFGDGPLGWVTFTSPRIARTFAEIFASDWKERRHTLQAAAIGAVTGDALRRLGVVPAAVAATADVAGLVAAIIAAELAGEG